MESRQKVSPARGGSTEAVGWAVGEAGDDCATAVCAAAVCTMAASAIMVSSRMWFFVIRLFFL
jgi:hypothetical protein